MPWLLVFFRFFGFTPLAWLLSTSVVVGLHTCSCRYLPLRFPRCLIIIHVHCIPYRFTSSARSISDHTSLTYATLRATPHELCSD